MKESGGAQSPAELGVLALCRGPFSWLMTELTWVAFCPKTGAFGPATPMDRAVNPNTVTRSEHILATARLGLRGLRHHRLSSMLVIRPIPGRLIADGDGLVFGLAPALRF